MSSCCNGISSAQVAAACSGHLNDDDCRYIASQEPEEAVAEAFRLLAQQGVTSPEALLEREGILVHAH